MNDRALFVEFGEKLASANRILLITHRDPDGDGIASTLAVSLVLEKLGKVVHCVSRDPVPETFRFLPGSHGFQQDFLTGEYDLVITMDCGDVRRTGFSERLIEFSKASRLINIDHHPKNDLHRLANLNLVNERASATAEIIFDLVDFFAWELDHEIATCLLCGLHTDTGGFKHPNTTVKVLEIASALLAAGGRLWEINRHIHNFRPIQMLKLWGIALSRLRYHEEFEIVSSLITLEDMRQCQATADDISGVVNFMKLIPHTKLAILFAEQEDGLVKASLRSEQHEINVAHLARLFGGGGLKKAGGFSIPARIRKDAHNWSMSWD